MDYIEWIRTIGLAVNLLVNTEFNSSVSVQFEWNQKLPDDLFTIDSVSALYLDFHSRHDSARLTGIYLIPWTDMFFPGVRPDELTLPKYNLFTVTEYSVIYQDIGSNLIPEANKELTENLLSRLKDIFDYEENQKEVSSLDGITLPENIQLISQKEYKYYIEQSVALPGSESTLHFSYDSFPENKMIFRRLVPDIGPVKLQWIFPVKVTKGGCSESADELVRKAINNIIDSLLKSESAELDDTCFKSISIIGTILNEHNCNDETIRKHYQNLVRKLLLCQDRHPRLSNED